MTANELLAEDLARYYDDPLGFVQWVFPWGKVGTILEGATGPRTWQAEYLEDIGRQVREREFDGVTAVAPIQKATASGHGIGKSCLTAWIILWIMEGIVYGEQWVVRIGDIWKEDKTDGIIGVLVNRRVVVVVHAGYGEDQ